MEYEVLSPGRPRGGVRDLYRHFNRLWGEHTIVFTSDRDGDYEIFIMDTDGAN